MRDRFSTLCFIWVSSSAMHSDTAHNLSQSSFMFQAQLAPTTPVFTQHSQVSKQRN